MSDSYILLLAHFSKRVDTGKDLLQLFSSTLSGKFDGEETPIRCVLLLSPQSGIVWARGLSVSELLVSKDFDLGDHLSVSFEFPRSQPSYLVEIVPKKKNSQLNLEKFQTVFDGLRGSFRGAVCMLMSDSRIVVKFADPDEAVRQCSSFVEPMMENGIETVSSRTILIKEHVVMRAFYVGGSRPFSQFEHSHKQLRGQSTVDFLHSKFSHFKDRPVVLSMHSLPPVAEKLESAVHADEEVNIACATHFDYRLLRNSPPVVFPGSDGSLVLRVNVETKSRKTAPLSAPITSLEAPVSIPAVKGPPALAPPPNLPHPSTLLTKTAAAPSGASVASSIPVTANAFIFWDYGSCPVDEAISSPEDLDSATVSTMTANLRGVIDRYAQFRRDTGCPVKVNSCHRHVFAPQGSSFKNIDRIPPSWGSFTKNDFKVHHYSKKCSADSLIRGVVEGIIKQGRGSQTPVLLCFVTNDPEFESIAAFLKLENQNDIILVHNSAANTATSLVKKHYSWNVVQDIAHNKKVAVEPRRNGKSGGRAEKDTKGSNDKEKDKQDRGKAGKATNGSGKGRRELEPGELEEGEDPDHYAGQQLVIPSGKELVPWSAGDGQSGGMLAFGIEDDPDLQRSGRKGGGKASKKEDTANALSSSASVDSGDNLKHRGGRGDNETVLDYDLKCSSVAAYIKRLLVWRKALDDEQGLVPHNYLLGEDTSGYEDDVAQICFLRIELNSKLKRYWLHVKGPSAAMVEKRFQRVKQMVDEAFKVRQSHNFHNWTAEHRSAIIGSEVLALQEKACRAVVMFHYSGNTTVAEIVALRSVQHNALLKFVQKLRPKETSIKVPFAFVCWYDADKWEKMRSAFAIKAEVLGEDGKPVNAKTGFISPEEADAVVSIRMWGFAPKLIDSAIAHIKLNDEREEVRAVDMTDEAVASQAAAAAMNATNVSAKSGRERGADKRLEREHDKAALAGRNTVQTAPSGHVAAKEEPAKKGTPVSAAESNSAREKDVTGVKDSKEKLSAEELPVPHKATYIFADREAGIYFYSFEKEFRLYLDKTFSVFVDETEHAAQLAILNSVADFKSDILKVTLYGTVQRNVQSARVYMDQFNTHVLGRHRIFFPRVSARKYREIYNKKCAQIQKMETMRENAAKSETEPLDPFQTPGFVNIRSKPPMNLTGKVNFPTDITMAICGPMLTTEEKTALEHNKVAFNTIPSEFSVATIVIPPTHHMKQALTHKAEREEVVKRFNLVAMRWEEGLKASGNIGTVKVWAYTKASLKIIVQEIFRQDMGGAPASHAPDDHDSFLPSSEASPTPITPSSADAAPLAMQPQPMPMHVPVGHPQSAALVSTGQPSMYVPNNRPADRDYSAHHPSPYGSASSPHNYPQLHTPSPPPHNMATREAMLAGAKVFASAKDAIRPIVRAPPPPPLPANHAKVVIHLPDLSLRYVMQGEPLKSKLGEVLERLLKSGAHIAYPYKDRADPSACFELEGEIDCVNRASEELNEFILRATRSLRVVQVILNTEQFHRFTNGGDGLLSGTNISVNEFQATNGVHCVFNPPVNSTREVFSLVDFRLASEFVNKEENADPYSLDHTLDLSLSPKPKPDTEMISMSVYNCYSERSVEISIISSNSSDAGWTWGVNNLLLLVGSNTLGYNPGELDTLNRGEVLVHADRLTGKTILRIRPSALTRGINYQAAVLTNALLKCLQKANELGLKGLAVSAPTDIDAFPDLNPELIRSLTVEAVVEFSKKCRSYLRFNKLVCIELGYNIVTMEAALERAATAAAPAAVAALERRIEPAQKDRMVRTMMMLLERNEAEHAEEVLHSTYNSKQGFPRGHPQHQVYQQRPPEIRSKMNIVTCNVPLPVQLLPALASHERNKGFKVFLVKGLLSSVVKSLDQIKTKLIIPKAIELDAPFDLTEFF